MEDAFHSVPMSSRLTKKSFGQAFQACRGEGVGLRAAEVRAEDAQTADEDGHFGRGQGQQLRTVDEKTLRLLAVWPRRR